MRKITDSVARLERAQGANGYVITREGRHAVVDPGLPFTAGAVVRELRDAGVLDDVDDILLTHYDLDHAGAAARLAAATGARTWIGAADAQILRGHAGAGTRFRWFLNRLGRPGLGDRTEAVDATGPVEILPGVTGVPTPGHTPGHLAFRFEDCLFIGDAALVRADGSLRQFPGFLVTDRAAARASADLLARSGATWILPGHGSARRMPGTSTGGTSTGATS